MADFKKDKNGNLTDKLEGDDHGIDALRYAYEDEYLRTKMKVY